LIKNIWIKRIVDRFLNVKKNKKPISIENANLYDIDITLDWDKQQDKKIN
jgi:hypothetical protein